MAVKVCKTVLKLLVKDIDFTAAEAKVSFNTVLDALATDHPEITVSEEEWNKLDEQTRNSLIDQAKETLKVIR
ncbi:hypothetical protein [Anaeroselena agilis]|uniref:Uncharacterized protein n=1 Tax=Anaeroselena agilis TaxID=3063788 RepID=A0ABU3P4X0_9FIRM|nr:hypothetical protein [Selenomonadales bacterium 4137-cl]